MGKKKDKVVKQGPKLYPCKRCKRVFPKKNIFDVHKKANKCKKQSGPYIPPKIFRCMFCNKSSPRKDIIDVHVSTCKIRDVINEVNDENDPRVLKEQLKIESKRNKKLREQLDISEKTVYKYSSKIEFRDKQIKQLRNELNKLRAKSVDDSQYNGPGLYIKLPHNLDDGDVDYYKIGKAENIKLRFKRYSTGCKNPDKPLFILKVPIDMIDRLESTVKSILKTERWDRVGATEIYRIPFDELLRVYYEAKIIVMG